MRSNDRPHIEHNEKKRETRHCHLILYLTGFNNFIRGSRTPTSVKPMEDNIHEACDDKVAARLREEMIPSLKILLRVVRFTNTGFSMTIEHAEDLDVFVPPSPGWFSGIHSDNSYVLCSSMPGGW